MNTNFVAIIKRIIAEQGEDILANPQRVKGFVQDYAARESKVERLAFGRCIEYGAYTELKNAPDAEARQRVKADLVQKVHNNEGLDVALCNSALDVLEAAVFGAIFGKKNLCKSCGKELLDGWKACPYCGAGASVPIQAPQAVRSPPPVQQYRPPQYQPPIQLRPLLQSPKKKKGGLFVFFRTLLILFVITVVMAVVSAIVWY
jgi:hypothetical protein